MYTRTEPATDDDEEYCCNTSFFWLCTFVNDKQTKREETPEIGNDVER